MERFDLNGSWTMRQLPDGRPMPAQIPGSVISTLLANGEIEDPYYRLNEYTVRERMRRDFVFERAFALPRRLGALENIELVCEGLDTIADVYLNGHLLGSADNMHRTWRFACREYLQTENVLRICFSSPIEYIEHYEERPGDEITVIQEGGMKGQQYIRKAHSMFGWDWGAQLPDMGIWRDIYLEGYAAVRLSEVHFRQHHIDGRVRLEAEVGVCGWDKTSCTAVVSLSDPDGVLLAEEEVSSAAPRAVFEIREPRLWWTNGLGEHPLYRVSVRLSAGEKEERVYRLGLRTLTVSQEEDEWGKEFAIQINGVKIFAKGADYIPEDCIYSRITYERLKMLIDASVRANFNCLRVWGGGYYPSDAFYDLCDENGLIVWQDLMYACAVYDFNEKFEANIVQETLDNVRRLRHHASLGLWCGNNEIESAWVGWEPFQTQSARLRADYIKQFEYVLPRVVAAEDPDTFYWPSSPSSGGCFDNPGDENRGDAHYWEVWHGQKPFLEYHSHFFRFCSEFGFQSFPNRKTVYSYTDESDRNIFSEVMESHQKNGAANGKILYYLSENFQYPKDFDSLLYVTQVLQGMAMKCGVEHWRRNRGRCMGALYWQLNDNWPVASWAGIDYYGRWKALHYMAKVFFAQKLGTLYQKDGCLFAAAVNDDLTDSSVRVTLTVKDMELRTVKSLEKTAVLPALSAVSLLEWDCRKLIAGRKNELFAEAVFEFADGRRMVQYEIFVPYKYLHLRKPEIKAEVRREEDGFAIRLQTDCYTPFIYLDLQRHDAIFSDNYFCLGDADVHTIHVKDCDITLEGCLPEEALTEKDLKEQLRIGHLYGTIR